MPTVTESLTAPTQLGATLQTGVDTLSYNQSITFTKYKRLVLPLDGYVFWVRAAILSPSALYNTTPNNKARYAQEETVSDEINPAFPDTVVANGSLHYETLLPQDQDSSAALNKIIFTSEQFIKDLNYDDPSIIYIGEWEGRQFSFNLRISFYKQAALWHYRGTAVTALMKTQIIDDPRFIDVQNVIVSNSLPIWLAMNQMMPPYPYPPSQQLPLFPAFLVPENLPPPFGSVYINPDSTEAIQATAYLDSTRGHWQLVEEDVDIMIYGYRNFNAMDFLDYVNNQSMIAQNFGIMNMPIVQDMQLTAAETQTIAQKKRIRFHINYYQQRARDVARQMLLSCIPSLSVVPAPIFSEELIQQSTVEV